MNKAAGHNYCFYYLWNIMMKATCNREGLLTAFQVVASVAAPRSPKPILRNVKLTVGDDGVATLMATDLEQGIRYRVSGVSVSDPGSVILPTSEMQSILRELPDETLELESTDGGLKVSAAASQFVLPSEEPLQFPEVPVLGDEPAHELPAESLAQMVRRVIFAAATEGSRYALNAVLIDFPEDGVINAVATDGKRMAVMPGKIKLGAERPTGFSLIPPKAFGLLQKILHDPEEVVKFALRPNEALFQTSKVTIHTRLVEGRYPRYQDVFPSKFNASVPLIVSRLLGVARQAKIVTTVESRGVVFTFSEGMLTLESRSPEAGASTIRLPIGYDGAEIAITFDPQLLIDALRVLEPEEEVTLELVDSRRAGVLTAKDGYRYVVMPLTKETRAGTS